MRTAKILIRLGGSESSLGARAISYFVLSRVGSHDLTKPPYQDVMRAGKWKTTTLNDTFLKSKGNENQ